MTFETITQNLDMILGGLAVTSAAVWSVRRWLRAQFTGRDHVLAHEIVAAGEVHDEVLFEHTNNINERLTRIEGKLDAALARMPKSRAKRSASEATESEPS